MSGPLANDRHERFCQALLAGKSASDAYRLAGFKPNDGNAIRLKANERIAARLAELRHRAADRAELSASTVLAEMGRIGMADIRRLFDANGQLKPIHALDADAAACIASIEVVTKGAKEAKPKKSGKPTGKKGAAEAEDEKPIDVETVTKVRLWDKRAALTDLGKHFGLFKDKVEHSGSVDMTFPDADDARARLKQFYAAEAERREAERLAAEPPKPPAPKAKKKARPTRKAPAKVAKPKKKAKR